MAEWKDPKDAPKEGQFLAKFAGDKSEILVLKRIKTRTGHYGVGNGMFEFDLGEMVGWYPLPEGLED